MSPDRYSAGKLPNGVQPEPSPDEWNGLIALAMRHHQAGRLPEAVAAYRQILERQPDWAEAHNNLGNALHDQGQLAEAVIRYERALDLRPDYAEACNNLGNALRQQGQPDLAIARFQQALTLRPDFAEVHNNLGNALHDSGRLDEAMACYERALSLHPHFAVAHNNLGNILKDQGRLNEATLHYQRALGLRPDYAEAQNNLANTLKSQGQLDQAIASYRQALVLRPGFAEAHYNLGNALQEQGQLDEAVASYERALELRPDLAIVHNNLGNVLKDQGKLALAVTRFRQALALQPDFAVAHNNLGNALEELGQLDQAVACYRQAIALDPAFAEAHNNLGNARKDQGDFALAASHYEQALQVDPDFAEAHSNRADLRTFRPGDVELAALETLAAQPDRLPARKMLCIHFALGKALDDVGDYARAFEHLLKGNALKRQLVAYDEAAWQETFRRIPEVFDASLFDRLQGAGDPSNVPIFVLGMPRSGSTLVEQILASHPQIYGAGELKQLSNIANNVVDVAKSPIPYPVCVQALDAQALRRLGRFYLDALPRHPLGKTRITDKTTTNFAYIGLIHLLLPNARIIHTQRDPVDTCLSCFSRLFSSGQNFSYDLAELGRFYRGYRQLMAFWRSVHPPAAILDVAYEDVVNDLEQQARRLIDYCGLPWDDRCLSFHKTSRPVATASNVQVRRPLYRSSLARWRRYEAYLEPLLAELSDEQPPK